MSQIKEFFDNFSKVYDNLAFEQSLGTRYLSKIETNFVLENCPIKKGDKILDMGIGTGRFASLLAKKGASIEGIDISEKMIKKAKKKLKEKSANFTVADAGEHIPFGDNSFNYIICIRVLKYIVPWKRTIKEVARVLNRDGLFLLEIPNLYSVQFFGLRKANYFLFNFNNVKNTLKQFNFEIIKLKGGSRFPFPIYKEINNISMLNAIKKVEWILDKLLPNLLFSRHIMIVCKKKGECV